MANDRMSTFSQTLKNWRKLRRFSQLDLATEAGISSRHLSFFETGRARPGRGMVLRQSEPLELPLEARNQLLNDAGYVAEYPQRTWSDDKMAPDQAGHQPYAAQSYDLSRPCGGQGL